MRFSIPVWVVVILCALSAACSHDLDENVIKPRAEGNPMQLDSEQVSLSYAQLTCGTDNELWEGPPPEAGQRSTYRLTQKARDLQFSDDIYVNDPGFPAPYTQLRGKFYLQLDRTVAISNGPDRATKFIQAQLGVKIPHPCFAAPLPIMGIRQGKFSASVAPTMIYENGDDGWQPTHLVH